MKLPPELLQFLLLTLYSILVSLLAYATAKLKRYLDTKTTSLAQQAALDRAWSFMQSEVSALNQTTISALRESASDGKLSKQDALRFKEMTIERVRRSLGEAGVRLLDQATGNRSVESYLESLLEAAVRKDKKGDLVAVLGDQRTSKPPTAEPEVKQ